MFKRSHSDATKKTIDTTAYLTVLRDLVENGQSVSLLISGNSMFPFLEHGRDTVYFEAPTRSLKKGDIVFYQRNNGQFVMHRICSVIGNKYYLIGDSQSIIEGPIERRQIFAIVTQVQRNRKIIDSSSLVWKFFNHVWINLIPYRKFLILPWRLLRKVKSFYF